MNARQTIIASSRSRVMASDGTVITRPRDVAVRMKTGRIYRTMDSRKIEIERLFQSIAAVNQREAEVLIVRLQRQLREPRRSKGDNIG